MTATLAFLASMSTPAVRAVYEAGRGSARAELAVLVEQLTLREGSPFSDRDDAALGAHRPVRLGQRAVIGDLQFELRIALAGFHAAMHGAAHDRVEQGRGVAAMHDTERVVDRLGRRACEHDKPFLGRYRCQVHRFANTLISRPPPPD